MLNLILGFLLLLLILYAGYEIARSKFAPRGVSEMVNVDPQSQVAMKWNLGPFEELIGTNYLLAPVYSTQNYRVSYYEKDASAVRNYLFVNAADKSSRWLVPNNRSLVLTLEKLVETGAAKSDVVKWLWYAIAKTDTDQDGRLTGNDRKTVAISNPTGEGYVELIQNVERILGSTFRNSNTLLVFYSTDNNHFVSEINLPEQRVTATQALAKIHSD